MDLLFFGVGGSGGWKVDFHVEFFFAIDDLFLLSAMANHYLRN